MTFWHDRRGADSASGGDGHQMRGPRPAGIIPFMSIKNDRLIRFVIFAVICMMIAVACSGPEAGTLGPSGDDDPTPTVIPDATETESDQQSSTDPIGEPEPTATEESDPPAASTDVPAEPEATSAPDVETPEATPSQPEPSPTPDPTATQTPPPVPEDPPDLPPGVLPDNRIIAYYGHPSTGQMGILGEYTKEDLLARLREQVAEYEAADPDTPVIPAFELIATVAQPDPGSDGTYLLYTGDEWIQEYVDFTAENDMLLFLDVQVGHSTIRDQLTLIWKWLQYPHVHVAIDPEFSTGPTHAPGTIIGGVDGNHVNIAIEMLSELALTNNLPPKILVVHQFDTQMILNKEVIQPLPGVDFVLHMDGWGTTEAKVGNYNHFVNNELVEYGGFKIFYKQDIPVMTAEEVVAMPPPPLFISYQ